MTVEPFSMNTPEAVLDDLRDRLVRTRALPQDLARGWDAGASPAYLCELLDYWRTNYDFRAAEARINSLKQFRANIAGTTLHFVHERSQHPGALPIVLTHGYPDSFLRFSKLIPLLTDPTAHGATASDAFHVVAPSMPGYAFSEKLTKSGGIFEFGGLFHELMSSELGYTRYAAHGGDWGTTVTEQLARSHSGAVIGIHLTDVPFWHAFQKPSDPSPAEQKFLAHNENFAMTEGGYAMIQGTRPQTLADSLNDSPLALAAWLIEKYQRWSDSGDDIETRFSKDELITFVMLYWVTESIGSSFLPYYDMMHAGAPRWILEKAKEWLGSSAVPTGFALFPKDIGHPPREWAARFFNVQRWTELPRGGHFAALEEPELLAREIREFFRPLRN
ncbi:MAG TPA: epoxide hydrolase [Polyangiaceae bacterium]|jgi:microsomal epoxide hydrolase